VKSLQRKWFEWRGPCFELMKQNQAIIAYVYFSVDRKMAVTLYLQFPIPTPHQTDLHHFCFSTKPTH